MRVTDETGGVDHAIQAVMDVTARPAINLGLLGKHLMPEK